MARRNSVGALRFFFHSADSTLMSIVGRCRRRRVAWRSRRMCALGLTGPSGTREGSFIALAHPRDPARILVICLDDARHQLVPNDVIGGVGYNGYSLDIPEQARRFRQA